MIVVSSAVPAGDGATSPSLPAISEPLLSHPAYPLLLLTNSLIPRRCPPLRRCNYCTSTLQALQILRLADPQSHDPTTSRRPCLCHRHLLGTPPAERRLRLSKISGEFPLTPGGSRPHDPRDCTPPSPLLLWPPIRSAVDLSAQSDVERRCAVSNTSSFWSCSQPRR